VYSVDGFSIGGRKLKISLQFRTIVLYIFFYLCGGTLGTAATTGLLYQPRMIDEGDCGEIGGMKIDRGNRSSRRKPAPTPLLSITKSHMTRPGFEPGTQRCEASYYYFVLTQA
jgi:hypothetical protein